MRRDETVMPVDPDDLPASSHAESEVEILRRILKGEGFSLDQIEFYVATKLHGYRERKLPALLGWTPEKVERVSRSLSLDRHGRELHHALWVALASARTRSRRR
jgi:hypothetical protein